MEQAQLNWITDFIWGIADDVLRDLYVHGKYRDIILPMPVLRRLDSVMEGAQPAAVLAIKVSLDNAGIVHQGQALRHRSLELAVARVERELELVREYRSRLIPDVVTGKLAVREAAARLPDESAVLEASEDEALAEEDEAGEGAELDDSSEEAMA